MMRKQHNGGWVIALSFILALMLTAMPLPDWALSWRPSWVALVLIYWCMALPERVGIGIAWCLGLLLDVQQGSVLGQHALGLSILAYITIRSHQRIRAFPRPQQALLVCCYLLLLELLNLWIQGLTGSPRLHWTVWMPALTGMLLWPWLFIMLRDVRRKNRVF